jgi:hypothetical protein
VSRHRLTPACTVLLAVLVAGCADETAIMVHVCFGPGAADGVTKMRLVVDGETRDAVAHVFPFPSGATTIDFSVRPGVEVSGRENIILTVVGLDDLGTLLLSRSVRTRFEPGVDRDLAVTLEAACRDVVCPDLDLEPQTCAGGTCGDVVEETATRCPAD